MDKFNKKSLNTLCSTLCYAMGIKKPKLAKPINIEFKNYIDNSLGGEKADRIIMYNPDAVAMWIYEKYNSYFAELKKHIDLELKLRTVMPSVTPVCFSTMYTGVNPIVHGIRKYEKPVLKIETIFDVLIKQGKKPVIIAEKDSSLSMIFQERKMDYFIYPTIEEVNKKALEILKEDKYDFVVIYNGNYDEAMHRHAPEGKESLKELKNNIEAYLKFANFIEENYKNHNTLLGFAMDHGCHKIDGGLGSHGLKMPEDLNICHLYKCYKKQ